MNFQDLAFWISIHALREEGDQVVSGVTKGVSDFYPRPPRGGRPAQPPASLWSVVFLSTPSARRATRSGPCKAHHGDISIHALREEGDDISKMKLDELKISIHALREEGDGMAAFCTVRLPDFYPRPPRGGRPQGQRSSHCGHQISIHALREEGDGLSDGLPPF